MILHFSHIGLTDGRTFTLGSLSTGLISTDPWRRGSGDRYSRRYHAEERHVARNLPLRAQRL